MITKRVSASLEVKEVIEEKDLELFEKASKEEKKKKKEEKAQG